MLVICDNSTLSALAEIGLIDLLPQLVGHVTIPAAIAREAAHPSAPAALRDWISNPPRLAQRGTRSRLPFGGNEMPRPR